MKIVIDDITYSLPASLLEVTLQQRIDFDQQYGRDLSDQLKIVSDVKDDSDQQIDFMQYRLDVATKTISFYGNIPLAIVQNTDALQIMAIYEKVLWPMSAEILFDNPDFILQNSFFWQDQEWSLQLPELKNESKMSFGEFLDAKQLVKDLYEDGNRKWEALLATACIFFRKKGETYSEDLSSVDESRYQLLKTLPLDYGLHAGFFLIGCAPSYQKDFRCSGRRKQKRAPGFVNI